MLYPCIKRSLTRVCKWLIINVIPIGFEPMTAFLEGRCSIQLSYGTKEEKNLRFSDIILSVLYNCQFTAKCVADKAKTAQFG